MVLATKHRRDIFRLCTYVAIFFAVYFAFFPPRDRSGELEVEKKKQRRERFDFNREMLSHRLFFRVDDCTEVSLPNDDEKIVQQEELEEDVSFDLSGVHTLKALEKELLRSRLSHYDSDESSSKSSAAFTFISIDKYYEQRAEESTAETEILNQSSFIPQCNDNFDKQLPQRESYGTDAHSQQDFAANVKSNIQQQQSYCIKLRDFLRRHLSKKSTMYSWSTNSAKETTMNASSVDNISYFSSQTNRDVLEPHNHVVDKRAKQKKVRLKDKLKRSLTTANIFKGGIPWRTKFNSKNRMKC